MRGEYLLSDFARLGPAVSLCIPHAHFTINRYASPISRALTCAGTTAHGLATGATICAVCMLGQDLDLPMNFRALFTSAQDLDPTINFRALFTSAQDLDPTINFLTHSTALATERCMHAHDDCLNTGPLLKLKSVTPAPHCLLLTPCFRAPAPPPPRRTCGACAAPSAGPARSSPPAGEGPAAPPTRPRPRPPRPRPRPRPAG